MINNIEEDFKNYFYSTAMYPLLNKFETKRKLTILSIISVWILYLVFFVFTFFMTDDAINTANVKYIGTPAVLRILLAFVCIVVSIFIYADYAGKISSIIFAKLFSFVGDFKALKPKNAKAYIVSGNKTTVIDKPKLISFLESLKIISFSPTTQILYHIKGEYRGHNIEVLNLSINGTIVTYLRSKSPVMFNGSTVIQFRDEAEEDDSRMAQRYAIQKQKSKDSILTNNEEFDKLYMVTSDQSQEVKSLLNPEVCNKLVEWNDIIEGDYRISYEKGYINMVFSYSAFSFFVPFLTPINNIESYKKTVSQIVNILSLLDSICNSV